MGRAEYLLHCGVSIAGSVGRRLNWSVEFCGESFHGGHKIGGAFGLLRPRNAEVDPSRVQAVDHFDVRTGTISGHTVLSQSVNPTASGNGHRGDGAADRRFEGSSSVLAG